MQTEIQSTGLQNCSPQVWDTPTASAQVGDYIRIPFTSVMRVVDRDVLEGGRVWLLVKPVTGSESEEWVLEPEEAASLGQPAKELQQQPAGLAGDSVSCQLQQPDAEAKTEYEQGRTHGQNDAESGWLPTYTAPLTSYAKGYLEGYDAVLNPTAQPPKSSAPQEWSVSYDSKWDWYRAYVGSLCVGHGTTHQEAERIAQRYIAVNEIIKGQNAGVMKAYAG